MSEREFIRYDGLCKDAACDAGGRHFHGDAGWKAYWGGLTDGQRAWIRNKARWEGISVSAVATDYGAPPELGDLEYGYYVDDPAPAVARSSSTPHEEKHDA